MTEDQEPYVSPYLTNPPLTSRERRMLEALRATVALIERHGLDLQGDRTDGHAHPAWAIAQAAIAEAERAGR